MPEENWLNDSVFTVENFLTPEECQKYIRISEDFGYEDALVSSPRGQVLRKDLRNNERVMFQNEEIAAWLWERASDFVPYQYDDRSAIGVNEMLRFYRYDPGQQFNWHQDFPFERDNGEQSYLTLIIYLNDDFAGGRPLSRIRIPRKCSMNSKSSRNREWRCSLSMRFIIKANR